jgi:hypothetical protein
VNIIECVVELQLETRTESNERRASDRIIILLCRLFFRSHSLLIPNLDHSLYLNLYQLSEGKVLVLGDDSGYECHYSKPLVNDATNDNECFHLYLMGRRWLASEVVFVTETSEVQSGQSRISTSPATQLVEVLLASISRQPTKEEQEVCSMMAEAS